MLRALGFVCHVDDTNDVVRGHGEVVDDFFYQRNPKKAVAVHLAVDDYYSVDFYLLA